MLRMFNSRLRTASAFAFLIVMLAVSFVWSSLDAAPAHAAPSVTQRLTDLNYIRDLLYGTWAGQYDTLRTNPNYSWMDWSQDGCSSPSLASMYTHAYGHACLRHDFMWRTLAVADEATGRIWNERNRWVADKGLQDDATAGCNATYTNWYHLPALNACIGTANLFYATVRIWKYDENRTSDETVSTDLRPTDYIQYPSATAIIDCGVVGSSNKCLPIHYVEIDGRPFSPQNIPYIAQGRTVAMQVVRANLQAPEGPPTAVNYGKTGELVLNVTWPLRAAKTEVSAACPTDRSTGRGVQTVYLDYSTYVPPTQPPTLDKTLKRTTLYVTACDVTTLSQENDDLLDFRPREATYNPTTQWTRLQTGEQIRHYENIKPNYSVGTPLSLSVSGEAEVYGSWLGADCVHRLRLYSYIDYHTFTVYQTANFVIDL